MFNKGKVIVNGGVDIELPRLNRSQRHDKSSFMPGLNVRTITEDDFAPGNECQIVLKHIRTGRKFRCNCRDQVSLGRGDSVSGGSSCLKVTSNTTVGRKHCIISLRDGSAYIEDCNSVNGTFVDGKRITKKVKLPLKCRLRLAEESYVLYINII